MLPSSPFRRFIAGVGLAIGLMSFASPDVAAEELVEDLPAVLSGQSFDALVSRAESARLERRFGETKATLEEARLLADSPRDRAILDLADGLLLSDVGDPIADEKLHSAAGLAGEAGLSNFEIIALVKLVEVNLSNDDLSAAQAVMAQLALLQGAAQLPLDSAIDLAKARIRAFENDPKSRDALMLVLGGGRLDPARPGEASLLLEAGRVAVLAEVADAAVMAFMAASLASDNRVAAEAEDELAQVFEDAGDSNEALRLSGVAISTAQADSNQTVIFRSAWRRGRIFAAAGRLDEAIASYRIAFQSLRSLRYATGRSFVAGRSVYRLQFGAFHQSFVDILTRLGGDGRQELLSEARAVIEDLKVEEVEDYFQERCVPEGSSLIRVSDVSNETAILYPIILPDRLEVLLERGGNIHRSSTEIAGSTLSALVRIARIDMEIYGRPYETRSSQLYDLLIRPFESQLEGVETLVFVPDGVLRLLPVAALYDGETFLAEKMGVATVLGLNLLEAGAGSPAQVNALVVGATTVDGFAPLPSVEGEISSIASTLGADILFEDDFQVEQFGATLQSKPFGLVHIASHAQIGGQPSDNYIAAKDGRIDMNRVALTLRARSLQTGEPLQLLTLSACATASGDDRAPLGLAGIAYRAGARSVLASLWPVFDEATAQLMADFYEGVARREGRASALRDAQIRLMNMDPGNRHPSVWAAFTIVGEWR